MKDVELLNKELRTKFEKNRNYLNFEKYVMSELLSPIEDYYNFVDLIEKNQDVIEGNNLYYIAAYINSLWLINNKVFSEKLNSELHKMDEYGKAITYYLNALDLRNEELQNRTNYIDFMQKSVAYSKNLKFVNNRLDLAKCMNKDKARVLYEEAKNNVIEVYTCEELKLKNIDWWLQSQRFIDEFILGTRISDSNFNALLKICDK